MMVSGILTPRLCKQELYLVWLCLVTYTTTTTTSLSLPLFLLFLGSSPSPYVVTNSGEDLPFFTCSMAVKCLRNRMDQLRLYKLAGNYFYTFMVTYFTGLNDILHNKMED